MVVQIVSQRSQWLQLSGALQTGCGVVFFQRNRTYLHVTCPKMFFDTPFSSTTSDSRNATLKSSVPLNFRTLQKRSRLAWSCWALLESKTSYRLEFQPLGRQPLPMAACLFAIGHQLAPQRSKDAIEKLREATGVLRSKVACP